MTQEPTQAELIAIGISQSYASMILSGSRKPSARVVAHIFDKTGWKHPSIDSLTDEQIKGILIAQPFKVAA